MVGSSRRPAPWRSGDLQCLPKSSSVSHPQQLAGVGACVPTPERQHEESAWQLTHLVRALALQAVVPFDVCHYLSEDRKGSSWCQDSCQRTQGAMRLTITLEACSSSPSGLLCAQEYLEYSDS